MVEQPDRVHVLRRRGKGSRLEHALAVHPHGETLAFAVEEDADAVPSPALDAHAFVHGQVLPSADVAQRAVVEEPQRYGVDELAIGTGVAHGHEVALAGVLGTGVHDDHAAVELGERAPRFEHGPPAGGDEGERPPRARGDRVGDPNNPRLAVGLGDLPAGRGLTTSGVVERLPQDYGPRSRFRRRRRRSRRNGKHGAERNKRRCCPAPHPAAHSDPIRAGLQRQRALGTGARAEFAHGLDNCSVRRDGFSRAPGLRDGGTVAERLVQTCRESNGGVGPIRVGALARARTAGLRGQQWHAHGQMRRAAEHASFQDREEIGPKRPGVVMENDDPVRAALAADLDLSDQLVRASHLVEIHERPEPTGEQRAAPELRNLVWNRSAQ